MTWSNVVCKTGANVFATQIKLYNKNLRVTLGLKLPHAVLNLQAGLQIVITPGTSIKLMVKKMVDFVKKMQPTCLELICSSQHNGG